MRIISLLITDNNTFEGLIKLRLPKNDPKVVDGTGVELDPEHHVSGRVPVSLMVTLQLQRTEYELLQHMEYNNISIKRLQSYQDVSFQKQPRFYGDADTGVAVSLHIAAKTKDSKALSVGNHIKG